MESVDEHVRSESMYPTTFFYLQENLTHYGFLCSDDALGCTHSDDGAAIVGSRTLSLRHELIHASASDLALPHRVLDEGLAVYFGSDLRRMGVAEPSDIRAAFDSVEDNVEWLPVELYPVAGHFVSFLVDKYGVADTISFVDATETGMSLDELVELSVEHLGGDLRVDLDEYQSSGPGCEVAQFSPMWFECEQTPPSIPILGCGSNEDLLPVDISLACSDGASGIEAGMIWKDILIDAPAPVFTFIYLDEGHPVEFIVRSCGSGCSSSFARVTSESAEAGQLPAAFELHEGLNLIRILKPIEAEGRVRFSIGMSCS
jgi:hypothetical protein